MKYDPAIVSVGLLVGAVALYSAAISPMMLSVSKARSELTDLSARLESIEMDIRMRDDIQKRIGDLESQMARCRSEWISPMLDSYAMRAKAFLDTMAREAGLVNVEYSEGSLRALPVPRNRLPKTRTARRTVRVHAQGDYAAIASFVMRAEAELPRMTVQSVKIVPEKNMSVDRQEMTLVLEWPCEGEVIK